MCLYMLDTDISSYIIKKRPLSVLARFEQLEREQLCISVITYAELCYGVARSSSQKINLPIIEDFTRHLTILPWNKQAALRYGRIRHDLESGGNPMGCMDLLIASHALSCDSILVTNNLKHFQRIPELIIENWVM